uniref:Uncharacterized protein n=1 Tax=Nelumbo nucifera TaxID=4432 RepID=A0A822XYM1_NELNU|nr:TPA_asm: hypothetical protein HUJ06_028192 [Nelumbo nucifera]
MEVMESRSGRVCVDPLTVWRKTLLFSCNGFTVIGSDRLLDFRIDNYMDSNREQILLMNGSGNPPPHHAFVYVIEGYYCQRSCQVLDESRKVMAEIKRKEAMSQGGRGGISFGVDVFLLIV